MLIVFWNDLNSIGAYYLKYAPEIALAFAFASAALAPAQNADLHKAGVAANHREKTVAPPETRVPLSAPGAHGATKNNLDQQLAKIERQSVKSGARKPVPHASSNPPKRSAQDAGNTKSINFAHQHHRSQGSNKRAKK
jgi:hypothetical protein